MRRFMLCGFVALLISLVAFGESVSITTPVLTFEEYAKFIGIYDSVVRIDIPEGSFDDDITIEFQMDIYLNEEPVNWMNVDHNAKIMPQKTQKLGAHVLPANSYPKTILLFLQPVGKLFSREYELSITVESRVGFSKTGPTKLELDDLNDPALNGGTSIKRRTPQFELDTGLPLYEFFAVSYGGIFRSGDYPPSIYAQAYDFYAVLSARFTKH